MRISSSRSGILRPRLAYIVTAYVDHLRPRNGRQAFQNVVREIFRREVAVLQQSTCLDFDVTNGAELLDKSSKRMKGADRLNKTKVEVEAAP